MTNSPQKSNSARGSFARQKASQKNNPESGAIQIGTRRELFVDDWLIEKMQDARLQLQRPERREIALSFDAPQEDSVAFPNSVLPWDGGWRLYYRAAILDLKDETNSTLSALAESRDGITFVRPELGLCEFHGSKRNNILSMRNGLLGMPPAFLDINPACPPEQRFKGLTMRSVPKDVNDGFPLAELYAMTSPDGLHWSLLQKAPLELLGQFDTINTAFWDTLAGCYRCYTRRWYYLDPTTGRKLSVDSSRNQIDVRNKENLRDAKFVRAIQHATSPDFIHWTEPELLQYADGKNATELYTNAIVPCPGAEHIYLGFPARFIGERKADPTHPEGSINDALFMSSRDGVHWNRWLDAWVCPGLDPLNWTNRNNYPVWGIVETSPTEWSMYISEHYRHAPLPVRMRRLAIRPWGFVSVHAEYTGGELLTKPFIFSGSFLHLNAKTSAAGSIQVEIQDESGQTVPGFALDDMAPWFGDALDAPVVWKNGGDLSSLVGRSVRLRFLLKDADLFALQFVK